jgi:hypothetical protein
MSANAQAVIEKIRALPANEQQQVFEEVAHLQSRQRAWAEQQAKMREMQGRHTGSGLLNRLLEARNQERARG